MSFAVVTVSGVVIGVHNTGEASRTIDLFTREYGLVRVVVQSARNSKKLAGISQWMAMGTFDVVRTAHGGRLIGGVAAVPVMVLSMPAMRVCASICAYMDRFIQGESPHVELFDWFTDIFISRSVSIQNTGDVHSQVRSAKIFILEALGYLSHNDESSITDADIARAEAVSLL